MKNSNGKIWVGNNKDSERIYLTTKMANRHGLIAGATGTGKTVTLRVLAESFSEAGVPVFLVDVKGDIAGISKRCEGTSSLAKRLLNLQIRKGDFEPTGYPVEFYDLYGNTGKSLHTTVEQLGSVLLARILNLNAVQTSILAITYKVAEDKDMNLNTLQDLKVVLNYMGEHRSDLALEYGNISLQSISSIVRAIVNLELNGGSEFFQEKASDISELFKKDERGYGVINLLDSRILISNGSLYAVFLLWIIDQLFKNLPENGDAEKPKMVFFFDEAHLLFDDMPKVLLTKIEQTVKLIRSKGIGIYFVTQNPRDIPDGILSQLGNKIEHALRAYTPMDQKALKAAAESFRKNESFDTQEAIENLGIGEAVVSFLDENGIPSKAERITIVPPQSYLGAVEFPKMKKENSVKEEKKVTYEKVDAEVVEKVPYQKKENKTSSKNVSTEQISRERQFGRALGYAFGQYILGTRYATH